MNPQNDLQRYFDRNENRLIDKWNHYFEVYDRHFSRFRYKPVTVLEIGVFQGGSLQMWKHYFGDQARIYGVDINPECKAFEEENIKIFIGSQSDRKFLRDLKKKIPKIDILIDDGGHLMRQQIITFEELFDHIHDHGIYLCEDIHTSYWLRFGGGYRRRGTFVEFSKKLIDLLQAFHSEQPALRVSDFTRSVKSLHYYDSILIIEKERRERPYPVRSGVPDISFSTPWDRNYIIKIKNVLVRNTNKILRFFRFSGFIWR